MIFEFFANLCFGIVEFLFDLLPNIPQLPVSFATSLENVFNVIFDNLDLLGIFIRIDTIKIMVPLVILAVNFEHIYHLVMWAIKKIPLSID